MKVFFLGRCNAISPGELSFAFLGSTDVVTSCAFDIKTLCGSISGTTSLRATSDFCHGGKNIFAVWPDWKYLSGEFVLLERRDVSRLLRDIVIARVKEARELDSWGKMFYISTV